MINDHLFVTGCAVLMKVDIKTWAVDHNLFICVAISPSLAYRGDPTTTSK